MTGLTSDFVFTYNSLNLIRERLDQAENPEDFFAAVDNLVLDPLNTLPLAGAIEFSDSLVPEDDGENAVLVFQGLGLVDRANAADPRLWTYLALTTQREYMLGRWQLEGVRNWKGRVLDRWLLLRPTRQGLVRHGIARLWWMAELTHDSSMSRPISRNSGDPHAYTRWVFANEDRVQAIFERELGSSPPVMWAVVEAMQGSTAPNQGQAIKDLAKEVRLRAGYQRLEALSEQALIEMMQEVQRT
ncbi:DUF6339 family protein [Terrabacter sp. RAF57]|uniref:DUF6339 family protein n=1 Tax=Terrabacter sp. RAF57 TaxID=3233063 RepID=UPI003F9590FA